MRHTRQIAPMKHLYITALAASILASCTSEPVPETTRPSPQAFVDCGVTDAEYFRLMALPQNDFDQDMDGGWRAIAYEDGCESVAGYLIEDYIVKYDIQPHTDNDILFWHVGQMHAHADDYERAKIFFEQSYLPDTPPDEHEYEWALYAEGTIAFLDKDRPALEAAIDKLAKIPVDPQRIASVRKMQAENPKVTFPEGFPEKPLNLIALEGLLGCFDQPYSEAYGKKCKAED